MSKKNKQTNKNLRRRAKESGSSTLISLYERSSMINSDQFEHSLSIATSNYRYVAQRKDVASVGRTADP